jgi:4-carboxymuconolactone decarboxylase
MTLEDPARRIATGRAKQTEILNGPVAAPTTLYEASWRDFIFAEVWTRPGLDQRSRFLISAAGASTANVSAQVLDGYVKGALALKLVSLAEWREAALHFAVYGGWSRGGILDAAVTRAAQSLGLEPVTSPAIRAEPWDPEARMAIGEKNFTDVMTFGGPKPPGHSAYAGGGILNFVFGEMWRRPGLDERARRWLTMVGVADSSSEIPIKSHVYAAMKSGNASVAEMQEFVLQYAVHAGWPRASVIDGAVMEQAERIKAGKSFIGP